MTIGIVSAVSENLEMDRVEIQTDAAINPGNSGGPLFSGNGQLVGINVTTVKERGGKIIEGISLAIAMSTIQRTVEKALAPSKDLDDGQESDSQATGHDGADSDTGYFFAAGEASHRGVRVDLSPLKGRVVQIGLPSISSQKPTFPTLYRVLTGNRFSLG